MGWGFDGEEKVLKKGGGYRLIDYGEEGEVWDVGFWEEWGEGEGEGGLGKDNGAFVRKGCRERQTGAQVLLQLDYLQDIKREVDREESTEKGLRKENEKREGSQ